MDQSCLIKRQSEKTNKKTHRSNKTFQIQSTHCNTKGWPVLTSPYCQFWQFFCWHNVLVHFQNPVWQAQTDTALSLWVSRAKHQLHLRSSSWPFCSDSPEWRSVYMCTWFWRHGDAFSMTENAFFRAFVTLRSQFHLHHRSQRALTEIGSKITPNLGLVL